MTGFLALITDRMATRRGAWITVAAWAVLAVVLTVLANKYPAPPPAFAFALPASAEASKADASIAREFPHSNGTAATIVLYRSGGLTAADRAEAQSIANWLRSPAAPSNLAGVVDPFSAPRPEADRLISNDGATLVIQASIEDRGGDSLTNGVDAIRRHIGSGSGGLEIRVTGPAGILADLTLLTSKILGSILLGTLLLVLVILGLVYRAPLLALLPVVAVAWAFTVASSLLTIGQHVTGVPLNGEATAFVPILLFGAGTDYTLFILSRYRPALTQERVAASAMRHALRAVAEPVLASGGVVFLGTLTLTLAAMPLNHDVGVALATSIACVLLAGLTLIPAVLIIFGRAAFWPSVPRFGHPEQARVRLWSRVGSFVVRRPAATTMLPIVVLLILATGVVQYQPRFAALDAYLRPSESLQGYTLLKQAFGAGSLAPTRVVVTSASVDPAPAAAVQQALSTSPGVASVTPAGVSQDGRVVLFEVQLRDDPYAPRAIDLVSQLRSTAREAITGAGGGQILIGGETAASYDTRAISAADTRMVVALVLILVSVVLGLFLRSMLAPIYLLLINALTFGAALGLVLYINRSILNSATASVQLPLLLFVFLSALGADYNIFLLSRVREEVRSYPLREAIRRSVSSTGGVITSAGIILAGTFCVLTIVPVRDGVETGLAVALGVLLDTFVVRSLLVPGITMLIGRNAWWPSKLAVREAGSCSRALHEEVVAQVTG
ncbi:MAG TPA: MMPL family transporter [Candidatus Acidoferrum sp.]|nr:MMPL family transporter [Candidatus Acidoferrum sp.]